MSIRLGNLWRRAHRKARRLVDPAHGTHPDVQAEAGVQLDGCILLGPIRIGLRSYANDSLLRNVTIGRYCSIGRRCSIGAAKHAIDGVTTHSFDARHDFDSDPPTAIGNDVWIGDNVVIVAGLTIGDGAVIGAGAVVVRDVPPYAVMGGVPARLIRMRFPADVAEALLASAWWEHGDAGLARIGDNRIESLRALKGDLGPRVPLAYGRLDRKL